MVGHVHYRSCRIVNFYVVLFRCLLSKKAKPVMNIVQEVLSCVLWFSTQSALVSSTNSTYRSMCDTHRNFSNAARLLIKGELVYIQSIYTTNFMTSYLICSCEQIGCPRLPATPRRPPIETQLQQFLWTIIKSYHQN